MDIKEIILTEKEDSILELDKLFADIGNKVSRSNAIAELKLLDIENIDE